MNNSTILSLLEKNKSQAQQISLGMTYALEQQYCQLYAAQEYKGIGAIVDLGCWLGATTIALAKGLEENKQCNSKQAIIHAFDRFIWQEYMNQQIETQDTENQYDIKKCQQGQSFLPIFEQLTQSYGDKIKTYPGDLCEIGWQNQPIEFLFIDAMKSWDLAATICQKFFPYLIPEKSIIVHQDFAHFHTSWIHLINYRLRDYFEPLYDIPASSSVVFKYKKAIPNDKLNFKYSFDSFNLDEAEAAFEYSFACTSPEKHSSIAAARIMFFAHQGQYKKAKLEFNRYLKQGYELNRDLKLALQFMIGKKFLLA